MKRTAPVLLASVALSVAAWAVAGLAQSAPSLGDRCRTRGETALQTRVARVFTTVDGDVEVRACAFDSRVPPAILGFVSKDNPLSGYRLSGRFVAARSRGEGCAREGCFGDRIRVTNLRTRTTRAVQGTTFVLGKNGRFAVVDKPLNGGPNTVVAYSRDRAVTLDTGAVVPGSLALGGSRLFWLKDDQPRTALLP